MPGDRGCCLWHCGLYVLSLKLSSLWVSLLKVRWFRDYLGSRFERVKYNATLSLPSPVQSGVPQGGFFGTVLFLALIHDLTKVIDINPMLSSSGGTIGYEDGVLIWISGPLVDAVKLQLKSAAKAVVPYMAINIWHKVHGPKPRNTQILWVRSGPKSPTVTIGLDWWQLMELESWAWNSTVVRNRIIISRPSHWPWQQLWALQDSWRCMPKFSSVVLK